MAIGIPLRTCLLLVVGIAFLAFQAESFVSERRKLDLTGPNCIEAVHVHDLIRLLAVVVVVVVVAAAVVVLLQSG